MKKSSNPDWRAGPPEERNARLASELRESAAKLDPLVTLSRSTQDEILRFRERYDGREVDAPLPPVMLRAVRISQRVQKGLRLAPPQVRRKLKTWIEGVSKDGLEVVREIPGFHDEPLKGKRKGQRSIRLSRSYRAISQVLNDGTICFALVEEVTKHGY